MIYNSTQRPILTYLAPKVKYSNCTVYEVVKGSALNVGGFHQRKVIYCRKFLRIPALVKTVYSNTLHQGKWIIVCSS
jgi:hypothetical protein